MTKSNIQYHCHACGFTTGKWAGCCLSCNEWNTLQEKHPSSTSGSQKIGHGTATNLTRLDTLPESIHQDRMLSGITEWDRVLGEGLLSGAFIILTGDPGIGKSTLLLQVAHAISTNRTVMYFSSEESLHQIKQRAARIGITDSALLLSDAASLDTIIATAQKHLPDVLILDSIQNCYLSNTERSLPGSISQLREAGFYLMKLAKEHNISVIITGHITKEGSMAGPKVLEHIVDGVFYLQGEDRWNVRILRSMKNRFGTINELGFFEMTTRGLSAISNINQHLLSQNSHAPGAALTCTIEGSRPLLLELQALCVATKFSMPQRVIAGLDPKRVLLIAALLEKYLHTKFSGFDVFFKVSGGCTVKESASDLAIALALLSSYFQKPLPKKSLGIGEISLTGQIKPVNHFDQRYTEAEKFGIKELFLAHGQQKKPLSGTRNFKHIYELIALFPEE